VGGNRCQRCGWALEWTDKGRDIMGDVPLCQDCWESFWTWFSSPTIVWSQATLSQQVRDRSWGLRDTVGVPLGPWEVVTRESERRKARENLARLRARQ